MSYPFESSVNTAGTPDWWQLANKYGLGRDGRKRWEANAQGILADTLEMLSNEHNDAIWRLQRDIASCDKKTVRGSCGMSNSAHYPECSLLSVMWTGVGGRGSVRPPKTSGRGSGEASKILCLGVRRNGSSRRTWLWQSAVSSATAAWLAQRWSAICRAMEGVFPGLEWLVWKGNGAGLVACSHTNHFPGLIRLH